MTPAGIDSDFFPVLWDVATELNSDPVNLAKSLFFESGIESIQNRQGQSFFGINQMSATNLANMGITPEDYLKLPVSVQLRDYVAPFWRSIVRRHNLSNLSARDIEWLNFLPATYVANADDSHVICSADDPGILGAAYRNNKGFDHGGKGFITAGDIAQSVENNAHGSRWESILANIQANAPASAILPQPKGVLLPLLLLITATATGYHFSPTFASWLSSFNLQSLVRFGK